MSKLEAYKRQKLAQRQAANTAYLQENAQQEGVVVLDQGIQYQVLTEGTGGVQPHAKDWVTVHYHGTLLDGKVFDSSVERNKPATFKLNNLIAAWQIVLPLMVEGDRWRLVVPPEWGYGDQAQGKIPAHSVLIFEIELLKIGR